LPDARERLVGLDAVQRAAQRIRPVAHGAPLLAVRPGLHVKAESLQVTGSFKFRGAEQRGGE